jgi:thiol-disulfide isomerase/thioredoxin
VIIELMLGVFSLMQELTRYNIHMPPLQASFWLNWPEGTPPPTGSAALKNRVILVDFWDYTCVNCLHTLPYVKAWNERYKEAGLLVLGIHSPEFGLSAVPAHLRQAVQDLGVTYPIAADNEYKIWQGFANKYWPAKYLIDGKGLLRHCHFGEGLYQDTERLIQALLNELPQHQNAAPVWPEPVANLRVMDDLSLSCPRPTPELYLGYQRGLLGNAEGSNLRDEAAVFRLPQVLLPETVFLQGGWHVDSQYIEFLGEKNEQGEASEVPGVIALPYQAAEVNLVLSPLPHSDAPADLADLPASVLLALDGKPLPQAYWGEDVVAHPQSGLPCVLVDRPRMYKLVKGGAYEAHELRLQTRCVGLQAYAFTFVTSPNNPAALKGSML